MAHECKAEIIASKARTYWVTAYADYIDNAREDGRDVEHLPRAGGGEDWFNVVPDNVPPKARKLAVVVYQACSWLDEQTIGSLKEAESIGHHLAMQSLGHGVGLADHDYDWKTTLRQYNVPHVMCDATAIGYRNHRLTTVHLHTSV